MRRCFRSEISQRVLNAGSVLEVAAVADSELKAAAAAKREPTVLKVPTYVEGIASGLPRSRDIRSNWKRLT